VTLNGAEINLTDSMGQTINKFSVNGTGFVDVSRGEDPGFGLFDAELVPAPIGEVLLNRIRMVAPGITDPSQRQGITDQVIAKVRVFGSTLGNVDLTSSELSFPITYCEGCLIKYPLEAIDTTVMPPTCTKAATDLPVPGCR